MKHVFWFTIVVILFLFLTTIYHDNLSGTISWVCDTGQCCLCSTHQQISGTAQQQKDSKKWRILQKWKIDLRSCISSVSQVHTRCKCLEVWWKSTRLCIVSPLYDRVRFLTTRKPDTSITIVLLPYCHLHHHLSSLPLMVIVIESHTDRICDADTHGSVSLKWLTEHLPLPLLCFPSLIPLYFRALAMLPKLEPDSSSQVSACLLSFIGLNNIPQHGPRVNERQQNSKMHYRHYRLVN